jgi:hypothetical protein
MSGLAVSCWRLVLVLRMTRDEKGVAVNAGNQNYGGYSVL